MHFEDQKSIAIGGLVIFVIFAVLALVVSLTGMIFSYRNGYFVKSGSAGDRKVRMKNE